MIFQPAALALALLLASSLNALGLAVAGLFALRMLRHWHPDIGSEAQIALERRTHLVSTLVVLSLLLSLPMLALFTHTADAMAPFFAGAMCAVGSLKANAWGLPALAVMLVGFFLAAAWLVLHRLDTRGWDQPLLLAKYRLLLLLAPLALAQAALLWLYFGGLKAEVITSCCGSLFGPAATGTLAELSALPEAIARPLFFLTLALTLAAGATLLVRGRLGRAFGVLAGLNFVVALAAIVAFIAPHIYEQPHHHCPFCLLQAEHGYAGWLLYPLLFLGTAAGLGAGLAAGVRAQSLHNEAPRLAAALARIAVAALASFGAAVSFYLWRSNLVM
ncbi:MAG: hypothetical protein FJ209_00555 [Betaproteobacteria bacterium]|nr:hypothetical protein [Betaproteobacteria bacterium]